MTQRRVLVLASALFASMLAKAIKIAGIKPE